MRTGAFAVLEHEGGIVSALLHQREGKLVVLLRLTMETGEYIRRQATIGDDAADGCHAVHIPLAVVLAVHQLQDAAAPTLHRQVDVLAYVGHVGDDLESFVAHVFRVRGGETDTYARRCLCHSAQQHWEGNRLSVRLLEAVGIDVLSQQGNFLVTLCHEVGHFIEDAFHITAALAATGVGNDAVGTEIVATTHNGHEAGDVVSADARGNDIPIGLCSGKLHVDGFLTGLYRGNQFGQSKIGIRSHHQVHMMVGD